MIQLPRFDSYERHLLDPNILSLLCDLAVGDTARPLRQVDVDWQAAYEAVSRNGLLGLTYLYLAANDTATYPPQAFREVITHTYRLSILRMTLIYRGVVKVLDQLNMAEIDYLVVKGPAVAHILYPEPMARVFNDLDVIVRERDWQAIHDLLVGMGFEQEENLPEPPPKVDPKSVPYETKYWNAQLNLKVEVHYDDILNAGLIARDVEGFWKRAIPIDVRGVRFKSLSLEDQLIHLCAHIHYHGYTRMSWFADIALLLRRHSDRLDWQQFLDIVRVEEVQVPTYYSLYFLQRLLGIAVPAHIMATLKPDRVRCWLHDRYMPPERILSFEPTSRPDFSFYFLPLYKRLLPDLLVMGRRREKLVYLLRLLIPPSDWLHFYYDFNDRRWLLLHYLLHPLKLFWVYLRETVQLIVTRQYVDYAPQPESGSSSKPS